MSKGYGFGGNGGTDRGGGPGRGGFCCIRGGAGDSIGFGLPEKTPPVPRGTSLPVIAVIDEARCIGCGLCLAICGQAAVSMENQLFVDPRRCNGCGECVGECPAEAIALDRRAPAHSG